MAIAKVEKQKPETTQPKAQEKIEYRLAKTEDTTRHQIVVSIHQKVIWKSAIGEYNEWKQVREWRFGPATYNKISEMMQNIKESEQGVKLSQIPQQSRETKPKYPRINEDYEDEEEED